MFFTARSMHTSTVYLCYMLCRRVLLRHVYMVLCTVHVEDTHSTNSRRNVRESFCAYFDVMQNRIMTAMWSDSVCTAEQSHFLVPLSPSHHHQSLFRRWVHHCCFGCLKWRVAPFFVFFGHGGHGVLVFSFGAVHRVLHLRVALAGVTTALVRYSTLLVPPRTTPVDY